MKIDTNTVRKALEGDSEAADELSMDIEDVCDSLCDEVDRLRQVLTLTQQVVSGTFQSGFTILVTGHQMNAIRDALK